MSTFFAIYLRNQNESRLNQSIKQIIKEMNKVLQANNKMKTDCAELIKRAEEEGKKNLATIQDLKEKIQENTTNNGKLVEKLKRHFQEVLAELKEESKEIKLLHTRTQESITNLQEVIRLAHNPEALVQRIIKLQEKINQGLQKEFKNIGMTSFNSQACKNIIENANKSLMEAIETYHNFSKQHRQNTGISNEEVKNQQDIVFFNSCIIGILNIAWTLPTNIQKNKKVIKRLSEEDKKFIESIEEDTLFISYPIIAFLVTKKLMSNIEAPSMIIGSGSTVSMGVEVGTEVGVNPI